ncbi:hypothetical protein FLBR109950_15890 [Flavobacterium branchiophilum]|uniref:Uncharacterized protein n=1 Tax=Flavobacterium branchiophilum (strain FL-15) TaxID=1034807 RepID=G2YZP7_FLABF|nr:hypothetical protein [Flavobacterium branchiophilum]CCB68156.1 Hypothetical protein FBFL15_p0002 [Flavobacterium branchiophilum FL-15]
MSDKIKTSEEVREELADKKVAKTYLAEFENGINHKLSRFEGVLANFKPTCEIKHKYDTDEIKRLNTALNEIVLKLQEISIPEKIEVLEKKENKITFTDRTTKWLTWFCSIAFVVAVGGFCYGYIAYSEVAKSNAESFEKGIFEGRNHIYNISTPAGKNRIDKNHPDWRTVR